MSAKSANDQLFVYGTLRRGAGSSAHHWLDRRAELLGQAWCQGRLYRIAHYPGLVLSEDTRDRVFGEVYRLHQPKSTLAALDRYEECGSGFPEPTEYVRRELPVTLNSGEPLMAWVYQYNRTVSEDAWIPRGDFLA